MKTHLVTSALLALLTGLTGVLQLSILQLAICSSVHRENRKYAAFINELPGLQFIRFRVNTFRVRINPVPCEQAVPDEFRSVPNSSGLV